MATQVQRRRGNTAQNNAFLGALGELAFNTELIGLRLHDGVTVGGHPIAMLSDVLSRVAKAGDTMTGALLLPDGTSSAPSLAKASNTAIGMYFAGNAQWFTGSSVGIFNGILSIGANFDVLLNRDAANTLALRNGTAAQAFRVYNTFTDASNYERGFFGWNSNRLDIGPQAAGTGTLRSIGLLSHVLFPTDNTFDIGASGATRPRDIFAGRNGTFGGWVNAIGLGTLGFILSTATSTFEWASRTKIGCNSTDGQLLFTNAAITDFGRVMFGGTSSSFPALKRSTTGLQFRLADDSAYTFADALEYRASGTKVVGAQGAAVSDAAGGANVDAEARTAINTLLARLRTHGLIAT